MACIKTVFGDEISRLTVPPDVCFATLSGIAAAQCGTPSLSLKYRDDEGDECCLRIADQCGWHAMAATSTLE